MIALKGELGAGKTTFARAFIRARGGGEAVPSPTFTLVQIYEIGDVPIWHFDAYRLRDPDEAWELGIEDAFRDGISLIEWPERLGPLLPARRLADNAVRRRLRPNARLCGSRPRRRLGRPARGPSERSAEEMGGGAAGTRSRNAGRRCTGFSQPRAGPVSRRSCSPAMRRSGATTG